jgi:hypothetical protein
MRLGAGAAVFAIAIATASPVRAGSQNLITNGSFEQDTAMYSNTQGGQITSSDLTGWTTGTCISACGGGGGSLFMFLAATGTYGGSAYSYVANGVDFQGTTVNFWSGPGASPDGGNAITQDAGNELGALQQSLSNLVVGDHYQLQFYQASMQAKDVNATTGFTADWTVSLGSQSQNSVNMVNAAQGYTGWTLVTMNFTATATNELLSFLANSPNSGEPPFVLLDGVSLYDIPEPASLALFGLGVGGVAMMRRRRSV